MAFSDYSCLFDGVNEYVTMGDVLNFEYNQPFSLSCWFRSSSTSGYLIAKRAASAGLFRGYSLRLFGSGVIRMYLSNDALVSGTSEVVVDTVATYADNNWHHVVVTWDGNASPGAAGLKIYVDGVLASTTIVYNTLGTNTILTTTAFNIASRSNGEVPLAGRVDEVAVYDKTLSLAEAQWIYNSNGYGTGQPRDLLTVGAPSNLVGWWRMGDGDTFPTLTDNSANTYDGTMVNMELADIVRDAPVLDSITLVGGYGFDLPPFGESFYLSPLVPGISWDVVATPPVVTYYSLAAYDSASRQYWTSTTVDFTSAPTPVGSWLSPTLTVLTSWT